MRYVPTKQLFNQRPIPERPEKESKGLVFKKKSLLMLRGLRLKKSFPNSNLFATSNTDLGNFLTSICAGCMCWLVGVAF